MKMFLTRDLGRREHKWANTSLWIGRPTRARGQARWFGVMGKTRRLFHGPWSGGLANTGGIRDFCRTYGIEPPESGGIIPLDVDAPTDADNAPVQEDEA